VRILIVGMGAVGTMHGWALSEAGHEVTHLIHKGRSEVYKHGLRLDIYDVRKGHSEQQLLTYQPPLTEEPRDECDLIIVPTKSYQAAEAVRTLKDAVPKASFLMFTANWDGPQAIDALLPRSRYVWGYSASTGGFSGQTLVANIQNCFRIGRIKGNDELLLQRVIEAFGKADIGPDFKENIIEWLWVHQALVAGMVAAAFYAGGLGELYGNTAMMRDYWIPATCEALQIVEKRGVAIAQYPDAEPFITKALIEQTIANNLKWAQTTWVKRVIDAGHHKTNPDEMRNFFREVYETGEKLRVSMPILNRCKERVFA
jgi:2-dehydropantoate 2-reductase